MTCQHDWDQRKRVCRSCGISVYAYLVTLDPRIAGSCIGCVEAGEAMREYDELFTQAVIDLFDDGPPRGIGPDGQTHSDPWCAMIAPIGSPEYRRGELCELCIERQDASDNQESR